MARTTKRVHIPDDVFLPLVVKVSKSGGSFDDATRMARDGETANNEKYNVADSTIEAKVMRTPTGLDYDEDGNLFYNGEEIDKDEVIRRFNLDKTDPEALNSSQIGLNLDLVLKGYKPLKFAGSATGTRRKTGVAIDNLAEQLGLELIA